MTENVSFPAYGMFLTTARQFVELNEGCIVPTDWREDVRKRSRADVLNVIRYHRISSRFKKLLEEKYGPKIRKTFKTKCLSENQEIS